MFKFLFFFVAHLFLQPPLSYSSFPFYLFIYLPFLWLGIHVAIIGANTSLCRSHSKAHLPTVCPPPRLKRSSTIDFTGVEDINLPAQIEDHTRSTMNLQPTQTNLK
jgi:hypothetical protein